MAQYTWTVPPPYTSSLSDETPDAVIEYLGKQGIIATSVAIIGDPYRLVIEANQDPTTALNNWGGQPSAKKDEYDKAVTATQAYLDKFRGGGTMTQADISKALAGIILIVERGGYGM